MGCSISPPISSHFYIQNPLIVCQLKFHLSSGLMVLLTCCWARTKLSPASPKFPNAGIFGGADEVLYAMLFFDEFNSPNTITDHPSESGLGVSKNQDISQIVLHSESEISDSHPSSDSGESKPSSQLLYFWLNSSKRPNLIKYRRRHVLWRMVLPSVVRSNAEHPAMTVKIMVWQAWRMVSFMTELLMFSIYDSSLEKPLR